MRDYHKLLVVIDPTTDAQAALDRAVELAKHHQAAITVFLSIFDLSYEMTSILSSVEREAMRQGVINQRSAWLDDLLQPYRNQGAQINSEVVWHNRPFESIINFAMEHQFDLIIKATHAHDKLKSVIFTPTDWHLMRKAPMPVLMVKDHAWGTKGKILCAVNINSDETDKDSLNHIIVKQGILLARQFDAEVHLVNGYPGTPVNLAIELPDFDAKSFNDSIKNQHQQRIEHLAHHYGIATSYCHVEEGLPEDVIPQMAQSLDVQLVILGTVGRTSLSAALIGNTAEHVIDSLDCDLLAVKPQGFRSPLQSN
ncbi:universal stress protein UspE [Shewanella sp. NIFS-20-20]|uniref:universal stress protein UspE n=1 Tax=Shewanella sp. NIFS-20-20 TaxID=2853806 RepID=UPI001C44A26C|nr:universal stress protein UspE [Shewanella sp. NIFS-20-20]MBV7315699.1 universal stress protein UspE [Shewanella sp. NIFS-20-20]